ncbi:winged helix-turn-helix domain-containing protein [Paenibacillus taichungensis]
MFSNKLSNEEPILKSIFKLSEISLTQINDQSKLKKIILEQHKKYLAVILDLQICSNDDLSFWKQLLDLSPLPILIFSSDSSKIYHVIQQQKATIHLAKPITDFCRYIHNEKEEKQRPVDVLEYIQLTKEVFFNITGHCIGKDSRCTPLSSTEFKLLFLLVRNRGKIFSSHELLDQLDLPGLATLYVHIQNIRSKIEKNPHDPQILINHRGRGYLVKIEDIE